MISSVVGFSILWFSILWYTLVDILHTDVNSYKIMGITLFTVVSIIIPPNSVIILTVVSMTTIHPFHFMTVWADHKCGYFFLSFFRHISRSFFDFSNSAHSRQYLQ